MPPLVESVSPKLLMCGLGPAFLVLLAVLLADQWSPIIIGMTLFFFLVIAIRGVRPFGDTIAYGVILAVVLTIWALMFLILQGPSFLSVILTALGSIMILLLIRRGFHKGFWTPVRQ